MRGEAAQFALAVIVETARQGAGRECAAP